MKAAVRCAFISAGLFTLAAPGMAAEHLNRWEILGLGCLAGLITTAMAWQGWGHE